MILRAEKGDAVPFGAEHRSAARPTPSITRSPKAFLYGPMNHSPLTKRPALTGNLPEERAVGFSPVACDRRSPHGNRPDTLQQRSPATSAFHALNDTSETTAARKKR